MTTLTVNQMQDFCKRYNLNMSELSTRILEIDTEECTLIDFINVNYDAAQCESLEEFCDMFTLDTIMLLNINESYVDLSSTSMCKIKRIA
jgi:hypothetical protein